MKLAKTAGLALVLAALVAMPTAATANRGHGPPHGQRHHKVFMPSHHHWHTGHWHHGHHHGHLGWWWIVGTTWFLYPRIVYPYPDYYASAAVVVPQAPVTNGPPPTQYWYYCESANAYYPYVSSCPEPWKSVPATPQ